MFVVRKYVNYETTVRNGCVCIVYGTNCAFVAKSSKFNIELEKFSVMMTADSGASCCLIEQRTFVTNSRELYLKSVLTN